MCTTTFNGASLNITKLIFSITSDTVAVCSPGPGPQKCPVLIPKRPACQPHREYLTRSFSGPTLRQSAPIFGCALRCLFYAVTLQRSHLVLAGIGPPQRPEIQVAMPSRRPSQTLHLLIRGPFGFAARIRGSPERRCQ